MIHMGRKSLVLCLLTAVLLCMASVAFAATGTVSVEELMLRKEASTKSDALQTLPKGTKLDIIYKDGSWYKVEYGKYTGYVYAVHVKVSGSVPDVDDVITLRKGDTGSDVKKLQERLKELGYFKGGTTYTFGEITEEAVKAFQKNNGLTVDGVAGKKTQDKLYSSSAKKASASTSASASDSDDDDTLRYGDRSDAVKKLQQRLKTLGYFDHSVTGYYGSVTVAAVKAFQTRNGLTADGVAGKSTLTKLNSSSAKSAADSAASTSDELKEGDEGTAVKELQQRLKELGYFNTYCTGTYGSVTVASVKAFQTRNGLTADGVAGKTTLTKLYSSSAKAASDGTLRYGDSSSEVKALQQRLKELGYFTDTCTGYFGGKTETALKAFQTRNGLTADGVAGSSTLTKLNSSSAKSAADSAASTSDELKEGDEGTAVKELQQRLKELGYFNTYCTGIYGSITTTAVKAFQTRNGLSVTGVANKATLTKLYSSSAKSAEDEEEDKTLTVGSTGDAVKALQTRLKELGYFDHSVTGTYGSITAAAVKAFQTRNSLTANGVANEATVTKLMSSSAVAAESATTYKTERLDWFNGGSSKFPRNAIIKIKDVRTGMTFNAKVLYGSNHLDVEPLTAADTAILLKINGGISFSYKRRPMLVLYNGHVYACSIYSEPHGDQTIYDNNFDGQFCLHFYGSKTHGTDRVDEDHAYCENYAYLYGNW